MTIRLGSRGMLPQRGEVWWVRLDPTIGSEIRKTRPCVVLTNNIFNQRRQTLVVVPISSSAPHSPPLTVAIRGKQVSGVAVLEHVRGVSKERFGQRYDVLDEDAMDEIGEALKKLLDLDMA